jgi:hypothetical protein
MKTERFVEQSISTRPSGRDGHHAGRKFDFDDLVLRPSP